MKHKINYLGFLSLLADVGLGGCTAGLFHIDGIFRI